MDDFLLFAGDKATLWGWKEVIERRLAHYRLTIHPAAQPQPVDEGIPFLGFVVYPWQRRLKRRKGIRYRRRLGRLIDQYVARLISFEQLTASVRGWANHARYGNTYGLRKALLSGRVIVSG